MTRPVITVFGAAGAQGGGLVRAILADPSARFAVRAVTSEPHSYTARALAHLGAQVVCANPGDAYSVLDAMRGAHGAFCMTDSRTCASPDDELAHAQTMAECAARAGVGHVVWSTSEDTREFVPPGSGQMPVLCGRYNVPQFDAKGEANRFFSDSRVPATLLYPSLTWDDIVHWCVQPRRDREAGVELVLPTAQAKIPGIAATDVGPCALAIFARRHELFGKSIGIAGEHLSAAQMAEQLALALGESVVHAGLAPAAFRALGFARADELGNLFQFQRDFERQHCAARSVACARELHPGLKTFAAWLAQRATTTAGSPSAPTRESPCALAR